MAIVTNVETRRGITYIDVDGTRLCAVKSASFKKLPLEPDDAIDELAYIDSLAQLQLNDCYECALTMLDFSARASGEMGRRLKQKGYLEPAVDAVISRLTSIGLLNDQDYAERMVKSASGKPIGHYMLKRKLRSKGIDEDAVEQALELVDDESQLESARAFAVNKLSKYAGLHPREARAKLSQALARRGFSWDVISQAIEGLWDGDEE